MNTLFDFIARDRLHLLNEIGYSDYLSEFDQKWTSSDLLREEDWSSEPELLSVVYSAIRTFKPRTIVEIGTYKGKSAVVFASALVENGKRGRIYSIDNGSTGYHNDATALAERHGLTGRITFIQKASERAFEEWGRAEINLLFIDGDHSFSSTCIDFALWSRYMKNGLIILHDTVTRLLRRFPEDYIFPLSQYRILNCVQMHEIPSGQEWEGAAFVWLRDEK